jgi:hypothetical protein
MKEKLMAIAKNLGLFDKIKEKKMTSEDWQKLSSEFKKEYNLDILQAVKDAQKLPKFEKEHEDAITALLASDNEEATVDDNTVANDAGAATQKNAAKPDEEGGKSAKIKEQVNVAEEIKGLKKLNADLTQKVEKMEQEPENSKGKKLKIEAQRAKITLGGFGHTAKHAFGIESEFFARTNPWNEVTATGLPRPSWSKPQLSAFKAEFDKYAESLGNRVAHLHEQGLLGRKDMVASINYDSFDSTGWGEEYVVRRQDALIAYIRSLPTVSTIFPVRYGVQNKMEMTNAFLGEFSQAYQGGHIYKGSYKLIPEIAKVDNVMMKHAFTELKQLEKEYIGYLNREGSDPIKWTFIEWLMVQTLKVLHNEREERRVRGRRIEPTIGTAGPFLFSADGVITRLRSFVPQFKIQPFEYSMYTNGTIFAYVATFVEAVNQILPSLRGYKLYMNEKHIPWYTAAYREEYGTQLDFKGAELKVMDFAIDAIVPVPNMGNSCLMWITLPDNIELYEDVVGEMEKFYFERDLEDMIVCSWWKEGVGAYLTGRQYASAAELAASGRVNQFIFMNNPYTELAANATTLDGTKNDRFVSVANGGATVITDITGKQEGIVYMLKCGSMTNATEVAKSGYFSNIDAWDPGAVDDYLEVSWNATTAKFVEVARLVTT